MVLLLVATFCPPVVSGRDGIRLSDGCTGAAEPPIESRRAVRAPRATSGRHQTEGWLEAWTELEPGTGCTFGITAEGGSDYMRNKVPRKVLESKASLVAPRERSRAALTTANYVFRNAVRVRGGVLRSARQPRRQGILIVRIGSSDSHAGRGIGRTWVEVPGPRTREGFLADLQARKGRPGGRVRHDPTVPSHICRIATSLSAERLHAMIQSPGNWCRPAFVICALIGIPLVPVPLAHFAVERRFNRALLVAVEARPLPGPEAA